MNTANLQLEGLYLALAALNDALAEKGVLDRVDISRALKRAEATALKDFRSEELSDAEQDAVAFGPRILLLANERDEGTPLPSFSDLARYLGLHKPARPERD